MNRISLSIACCLLAIFLSLSARSYAHQNVLLIIADDLGVDVLDVDHDKDQVSVKTRTDATSTTQAHVLPNISTLLANGVYFSNTWTMPVCSPTRATLYTGLEPWKTGVGYAEKNYVLESPLPGMQRKTKTIANFICDGDGPRTCGLFGKWHLGGEDQPNDSTGEGNFLLTPLNRGWDYYAGNLGSHLVPNDGNPPYTHWTKYRSNATGDGYAESIMVNTYATQDVVDEAKSWIAAQTGNWFATLAFNAPHSPFHVAPEGSYEDETITDTDENAYDDDAQYNTMVQSLDHYLGLLLDPEYGPDISDQLTNTLIFFLGDNGTPDDVSIADRAKNTVYVGGVHVPLIIADGAKVVNSDLAPAYLSSSVISRTQDNPVNVADLFRTIIARSGGTLPSGPVTGSPSERLPFGAHSWDLSEYLQGGAPSKRRIFNFAQKYTQRGAAHATLSAWITPADCPGDYVDRTFKLNYQNGCWELFDLSVSPEEEAQLNVFDHPTYACQQALLRGEMQNHRMTVNHDFPADAGERCQ